MNLERDRRLRSYTLLPGVIIGIVAGALGGLGFALGGYGQGAATTRNPGALVFFVVPPAICWLLGWVAYRIALRFARDDDQSP